MYDWLCAPTGTITSLPKAYTALELNPKDGYQGNYFSPGLYCPSGWATVGIASRDGHRPVNSSGVVSPTMPVPTSVTVPLPNLAENAFMQLLEPSETAVWCCPSSMTGNMMIGCYSTLPDYKVSTACEVVMPGDDFSIISTTYLFDGTMVTGALETITATHPMSTHQFTLTGTATSGIAAVTVAPFVTLVHKPTDIASSSTSNAAARLSSVPSFSEHVFVPFLSVWMVGMTLGAAIVLPW